MRFRTGEAEHGSVSGSKRRVRIYPLSRASSEAVRRERRRAAEREYQLLDGIAHDGILRVESLTNAEQGPALIFEHDPDAERLDRFLERRSANGLDLAARLDLLRQLAETLKYAHERRLYHRALNPLKVLVTAPDSERPRLKIFDWRAGEHDARGGSSTAETPGTGAAATLGLNQRLDDFFETNLHTQLSNLGLTEADLRAWSPPKSVRRGRGRKQDR